MIEHEILMGTSILSITSSSSVVTFGRDLPQVSSNHKESDWSGLWDGSQALPESTEIIYHSVETSGGQKSEDLDPLASFFLVLAGILLIASTIIVGILLREKEKKEEKSKKTSK